MFITRATRHDKADLRELLETNDWGDSNIDEGTAFIARDGRIAGCIRLIEVEPGALVLDDVLVREDRRGQGIGRSLMNAVMNSRGGTLYLCCHADVLDFYRRFGFEEITIDDAPEPVVEYWRKVDDYPTPPGHVHHFMKAR